MRESTPKASGGLRVAAGLCLGALTFATVRIITSHAGAPLLDSLHDIRESSAGWVLFSMPFAIFASLYVLISGRVPNLNASPVQLDENPVRPKGYWIGMAVIWTAIAFFLGIVVYLVYFFE